MLRYTLYLSLRLWHDVGAVAVALRLCAFGLLVLVLVPLPVVVSLLVPLLVLAEAA